MKSSTYVKRRFRRAKTSKAKLTLKKFVRQLAESGDKVAQAWLDNKTSYVNAAAKEARIQNKGARISLEKNATKLARRRKADGRKTQATTMKTSA